MLDGEWMTVTITALPKPKAKKITLHTWSTSDKPALMALCNAVDRTFLSDRLPHRIIGQVQRIPYCCQSIGK